MRPKNYRALGSAFGGALRSTFDGYPDTAQSPENDSAITVEDLWFRYDGSNAPVLQGLTTAITPRAVTAILGPNGVGKTTLLNLLLGWLRPSHGELHIFGRSLRELTRREMGQALSLTADGTTVIFTTHDPEFAAVCADELLLVRDGTLLAHGSISETMTAPLLSRLFGLPLSVTSVAGAPVVRW